MKTSQEIQLLALQRLAEARVLHQNGFHDGAFYLGGYAVELALKAIICKHLDIDNFFAENKPYSKPLKVHDYETLLVFAGLQQKHQQQKSSDPVFLKNWQRIRTWTSEDRYVANHRDAKQVVEFLDAIDHPQNGILTWLQKHW